MRICIKMYNGWNLHYEFENHTDTEDEFFEEESNNENDEQFPLELEKYKDDEPHPVTCSQSAPGELNYVPIHSQKTSRTSKFLDYIAGECDSDLEDLIDSEEFETTVLYKNADFRESSSETDYETRDFIENKPRKVFPLKISESGISITTHHKAGMIDEDIEDPNLRGFGQAHTMLPTLTVKEQLMLGIIPNYKSVSKEIFEKTSPSTRKSSPRTQMHDGILSIERIKICDDPAAAGDNSTINASSLDWQPLKKSEERMTISATRSFKKAVQNMFQDFPKNSNFVLEKKVLPMDQHCLKLSSNRLADPKPVLTLTTPPKSALFPTMPSLELRRCSAQHKLDIEDLHYKSPKLPHRLRMRSKYIKSRNNCHSSYSWRAKSKDVILDEEFRESCAKLWSYKLTPEYQNTTTTAPTHSCSEMKCDKLKKIKATKKVEFTYTSHESFFKPSNPPRELYYFLRSEPSSDFLIQDSNAAESAESQETIPNCVEQFVEESWQTNSSSSESSKKMFTIFSPKQKSSSSSSTTEYDMNEANSLSYTILKSRIEQLNGSQMLSGRKLLRQRSFPSQDSLTTRSSGDDSETTFSPDSQTTDSSFADECFLNEHKMTDKMTFKFLLDEVGSEVEISVALPFPVPCKDLPLESPLMAAAILGKAQELVLKSLGYSTKADFHEVHNNSQIMKLPSLQCSVSLEELLEKTSEIVHYRPITPAVRNSESSPAVLLPSKINPDNSPPQLHAKDSWMRIMKFIIRLLLCGCCHKRFQKISPTVELSRCNKVEQK